MDLTFVLVFGFAIGAIGLLAALESLRSQRPGQVAIGAGSLAALPVAAVTILALATTTWEDDADVVDRTSGTVERLLREEVVVLLDGTQERRLAPRQPHRPEVGDPVVVTITRVGQREPALGRTAAEVDADIARSQARRPPAPRDLVWVLVPLVAGVAVAAQVRTRVADRRDVRHRRP